MAHIFGETFVASDRVFALDESGGAHVFLQSAPLGATTAPVAVGHLIDPSFRVYVGSGDGTISLFRRGDLVDPPTTFAVGRPLLWSLTHAHGVLYVGTGTFETPEPASVLALDDTTGAVLWDQPLPAPVVPPPAIAYSNGAPFRVIVATAGQDQRVRALDLGSGAEVWSQPDYVLSALVHHEDVIYYADIDDNSLRARSAHDGSLIWEYVNPANDNFNRPVLSGGVVYATSIGSQVVALAAATGQLLWAVPNPGGGGLGAPVHYVDQQQGVTLVIFAQGQFGIGQAFLQAVDATTGALVWVSATPVAGEGEASTEPILSAAGVQVGTPDGRLVSLDPLTGQLNWERQLTGESIIARPRWVNW